METYYWQFSVREHFKLKEGRMDLKDCYPNSKQYLGEYNPPKFTYILGLGWDINKLIFRQLKSEYDRAYAKRRRETMVIIHDELSIVTFWVRYELRNNIREVIERKKYRRTAFSNWSITYGWESKGPYPPSKVTFNRKRSKFHCNEILEPANKKQRLT